MVVVVGGGGASQRLLSLNRTTVSVVLLLGLWLLWAVTMNLLTSFWQKEWHLKISKYILKTLYESPLDFLYNDKELNRCLFCFKSPWHQNALEKSTKGHFFRVNMFEALKKLRTFGKSWEHLGGIEIIGKIEKKVLKSC